jgi:hypothetical protein
MAGLIFVVKKLTLNPISMKKIAVMLFFSLMLFSCEKESDPGQQIYFNSFESQSDVTGWIGNAFNFSDDVPSQGGKKSLSVSGGCVLPHAQYSVPPQNTDCYLFLKFWGKNLSNGGSVHLYVNKSGYKEFSFEVSGKGWTLYEGRDSLFCPANTSLTLEAMAGGITGSAILIDMVEIRKLNVNP